jgi:hypothetical protein
MAAKERFLELPSFISCSDPSRSFSRGCDSALSEVFSMSAQGKEETSCEDLGSYISEFKRDFKSRRTAKSRAYLYWVLTQMVSLLSGFVVAILVAIGGSNLKILTVILSALGSLAVTALIQLHLYDLWKLRKDMLPLHEELLADSVRRFAAVTDPAACSELHVRIIAKRKELVTAEKDRWFATLGKQAVTFSKKHSPLK